MFTKILVPTDFTASADAALALARRAFPETERLLLHVLEPQRIASSLTSSVSARDDRDAFEARLLAQLEASALPGEVCKVAVGTPVDTIVAEADAWNADLIVMGTHGRTGLALFLNGSVAERVVRIAQRPVLIEHETTS